MKDSKIIIKLRSRGSFEKSLPHELQAQIISPLACDLQIEPAVTQNPSGSSIINYKRLQLAENRNI